MPFFHTLAKSARESGVRLLGVTPESPAVNASYLSQHGVDVDNVISARESGLIPLPTPSVLLIRKGGSVAQSWVGKLTGEGQLQLLRAVGRGR